MSLSKITKLQDRTEKIATVVNDLIVSTRKVRGAIIIYYDSLRQTGDNMKVC